MECHLKLQTNPFRSENFFRFLKVQNQSLVRCDPSLFDRFEQQLTTWPAAMVGHKIIHRVSSRILLLVGQPARGSVRRSELPGGEILVIPSVRRLNPPSESRFPREILRGGGRRLISGKDRKTWKHIFYKSFRILHCFATLLFVHDN